LDKYATKFARIQEKQKVVFPYELLSKNTFLEGKNISEEEYNTYKELSKQLL
jgi:hypothetical protein